MYESLEALFNRLDADPEAVLQEEDALAELFGELGTAVGSACHADLGAAVSGLIVYVAEEATSRTPATAVFISGVLAEFCAPNSILTTEARAVCATL